MSNMNSTTPDFSEDKGLTYSIQQYVAAKNSTTTTKIDSRRSSAPELTGDKEQMQAVGVVGDAVKGSAGHISPAKTTNTAKAM